MRALSQSICGPVLKPQEPQTSEKRETSVIDILALWLPGPVLKWAELIVRSIGIDNSVENSLSASTWRAACEREPVSYTHLTLPTKA